MKIFRSPAYNYDFNTKTGLFLRWGKTDKDDPNFSPVGPEILDLEVSTICHGPGIPCPFCYKNNTGQGKNMSLDTFKRIFHKFPKNLSQIAFGIGDIEANPDLFDIMTYCRHNNYNYVVPNITINGYNLTDDQAGKLTDVCGAISVSRYSPRDICYDAVEKLTDLGHGQVNMHMLLSEESYDECLKTLEDIENDRRLEKLNAIVFLMLKNKGRGKGYHGIKSVEKYKALTDKAYEYEITFGMDSCSAPVLFKAVEARQDLDTILQYSEPCESGLFSLYVNVEGTAFPCSFSEFSPGWEDGLSVLHLKDFMKDIWNSNKMVGWRENLLKSSQSCSCRFKGSCRSCPIYDVSCCKTGSP